MQQNPYNLVKDGNISNPLEAREGVVQEADPLALDVDDKDLVKVLTKRIEDSKRFFDGEKYQLGTRREKNERYLFGRQVSTLEKANKYRPYEVKYQDNALYEIEASIKPVAFSRMPDMMVLPGSDTPESEQTAKDLSLIIDSDIKKRENRRILSMAFRHLPVYFTGIIKCRWNPELGETGDYEFEVVHPENIVIDEQCTTNNADDMRFVAQAMKISVQEVIMRFPDKKEEFIKEMVKSGIKVKDPEEWSKMATTIKIWEVWFTWYKKKNDVEWERIEGVLWKYGDCILKKMRNPNYDYEGVEKYFTYQVPGDESTKRESTADEMMYASMLGLPPQMQQETIYRNYFDQPHKPFFFMGYDQWGKVAYDETSRIEQNIYNQENMDSIGKRVIEKLKNRGKHIFSKETGMTGKDIEKTDMNNPDQDLLVDGDVNKVHGFIPPIEPTQQEFAELKLARDRMFSLSGATNLNGQLQSDTATSNQIAREANFSRVDDLTEDTVNNAADWMSQWIMQMIKLRYTEEHMRKILGGKKGSVTFIRLKGDMIEDGMEVKIKASGTDKIKRQRNALEMAKLKLTDPLSFFEDMDMNDPEGRAERLLMLQADPLGYLMQFVKKMSPEEQAQALMNNPMPQTGAPTGGSQTPPNTNPQGPTPGDTSNVPTEPAQGVQASPGNGVL